MRLLSVFKWLLFILLLAGIAIGAMSGWFWYQRDSLVHQALIDRFDEHAPELRLIIKAVDVPGSDRVILNGVEIRDRSTDLPLFRTKRVEVSIDSQQLVDQQRVVVQSVSLASADVLLSREADGTWNWQNYQFLSARSELLIVYCHRLLLRICEFS